MPWRLDHADCLEVLRASTADTVDSLVSDPPAGIAFMGREWDDFAGREAFVLFMTEVMRECYRVLKPGGHGLIWAIPRTSHWTATALETAGFEIRDVITHHFGSGFPKSQDVGKFIDKLAGAEREVVGKRKQAFGLSAELGWNANSLSRSPVTIEDTAPATEDAKTWDGWGTALKPATEHWILIRKPLSETSIARNVLKHGTGALNIDACRVTRDAADVPGWHQSGAKGSNGYLGSKDARSETFAIRDMSPEEIQERCGDKGRWPTNLLLSHAPDCTLSATVTLRGDPREPQHGTRPGGFVATGAENGDGKPCGPLYGHETLGVWECVDGCPVAELDRQSGVSKSRGGSVRKGTVPHEGRWRLGHECRVPLDSGGASRFFPTFHYFAKPARREREAGLEHEPTRTLNRVNPGGLEHEKRFAPIAVKNNHPTVKGKKLMAWLITLVTPPKGTVLDPFAGSGSTGVAAIEKGFAFWGIEKDKDYYRIAEKRIEFACLEAAGQQSLFDEEDFA